MRFYVIQDDSYIYEIGIGRSGEEISEERYGAIMQAIKNKPAATDTTDYKLTVDLQWEAYHVDPKPEGDLDAEEALSIILGENGEEE